MVDKNEIVNNPSNSFYNKIAGNYDSLMDVGALIRKKVSDYFLDHVSAKTVLDFGGGTGQDLYWLAENFDCVLFLEPAHEMKKKALEKQIVDNLGDNITFIGEKDCDYRTWTDSQIESLKTDAILSNFCVINSIPQLQLLFEQLHRCLIENGDLIFVVLDGRPSQMMRKYFRPWVKSFLNVDPPHFLPTTSDADHKTYIHSLRMIRNISSSKFRFIQFMTLENDLILIHLKSK